MTFKFNVVYLTLFFVFGCTLVQLGLAEHGARAANWYDDSHSKQSNPNYSIVFPADRINILSITISPEDWQAMQDNMVQLYGEVPEITDLQAVEVDTVQNIDTELDVATATNTSTDLSATLTTTDLSTNFPTDTSIDDASSDSINSPIENSLIENNPSDEVLPTSSVDSVSSAHSVSSTHSGLTTSGQSYALSELPTTVSGISANPMWARATVRFNDRTWNDVGIRYKGNSSLSRSWFSGSKKMPFKFDFDEFEDDFPEIKNQRFYGFKQLSLNNNTGDASFMRDAASYNIMEDMGLVAPKTAWYEIYLDHGQGAESLGIYTMIEVADDTVIKSFYGSDKGNIYEADGAGASLSRDTISELMGSFQKENNKKSDYSDIAKFFQVIHSNYRVSEAERWRSELENVFDVDSFLTWLATNTVIQNWDTYGAIAHNFYLYNIPETGQFSWIGWDYNESMGARAYLSSSRISNSLSPAVTVTSSVHQSSSMQSSSVQSSSVQSSSVQTKGLAATTTSLDHSSISNDWPLIRFLMDDPVYFESYKGYVEEAITTAFNPQSMSQTYSFWSGMLRPYADDVVAFETEVARLKDHGVARAQAVSSFLSGDSIVSSE